MSKYYGVSGHEENIEWEKKAFYWIQMIFGVMWMQTHVASAY